MSQDSLYHESLIQCVRAGVTGDILGHMHGIEITEDWLFGTLGKEEEKSFCDPDDVYFDVQKRERKERIKEGLAPRIHFLDQKPASKEKT